LTCSTLKRIQLASSTYTPTATQNKHFLFDCHISWLSLEAPTVAATSTRSSTRSRLWQRQAGREQSLTFPSGFTSTVPPTWTAPPLLSLVAWPTPTAKTVRRWPSSSTVNPTSGRKGLQLKLEDIIILVQGFLTTARLNFLYFIQTILTFLISIEGSTNSYKYFFSCLGFKLHCHCGRRYQWKCFVVNWSLCSGN